MGKEALKIPFLDPEDDPAMFDTSRHIPKAENGEYAKWNYIVVDPVEHMVWHNIRRERPEKLDDLKSAIDEREQLLKLRIKISNQLLAFARRTDSEYSKEVLEKMFEEATALEAASRKKLEKFAIEYREYDTLMNACMSIRGVGPLTAAYLIVYVDLTKAPNCSSVWKYVGYHAASWQRYQKTVAGGGNKKLRTALYRTACAMIKLGSPYAEVYYARKDKTSQSELMTSSYNTQGVRVQCAWKDTKPSHRHGDAMRVMMKHFLRDYWKVGRTIMGLPINDPYAAEHLGHEHIIPPQARGWPME